jgi:hypothetical protein
VRRAVRILLGVGFGQRPAGIDDGFDIAFAGLPDDRPIAWDQRLRCADCNDQDFSPAPPPVASMLQTI